MLHVAPGWPHITTCPANEFGIAPRVANFRRPLSNLCRRRISGGDMLTEYLAPRRTPKAVDRRFGLTAEGTNASPICVDDFDVRAGEASDMIM